MQTRQGRSQPIMLVVPKRRDERFLKKVLIRRWK
jgi:hypothetical protein